MQAVISNTLVNTLKPADKPYEVRDTQLKGLILRVQPSGVMTYYLEYARAKRVRIGRANALSPKKARKDAGDVLGDTYKGKDPAAERIDEISYDEVIARKLQIMDTNAIVLCRDYDMPIRIFNVFSESQLADLISGDNIGTLIH